MTKFLIAFDDVNLLLLLLIATASIEAFKLDDTTVQVMFEYLTTDAINADNRLATALILKNLIKKIYGVS